MRVESLILALCKRREALQEEIFKRPPQDHYEFTKRLGIWTGLGEALSEIEDARKKESNDDD